MRTLDSSQTRTDRSASANAGVISLQIDEWAALRRYATPWKDLPGSVRDRPFEEASACEASPSAIRTM